MQRISLIVAALGVACGKVNTSHMDAPSSIDAPHDTGNNAPTVTITSMPPASTPTTTASFTFTSSDLNATFTCSLDAATPGGCSSPANYMALMPGMHTFEVDAHGMGGTGVAMYSWTVEQPCVASLIEAENISVHPNWVISSGGVLHNGEALFANVINSPFSVTFIGESFTMYYEKGPNMGSYSVTIDTMTPVAVPATDPAGFSFQNPTLVVSGMPNVQHTASVSCAATYCEVDYFAIGCM